MQIRCSKSSCMEKENRLYSISLGVASFAGWFGRCRNCFISCNVQAISSFLVHHFLSDWSLIYGSSVDRPALPLYKTIPHRLGGPRTTTRKTGGNHDH